MNDNKKNFNELLEKVLGVSIEEKYDAPAILEIHKHPENYPYASEPVERVFSAFIEDYEKCKKCCGQYQQECGDLVLAPGWDEMYDSDSNEIKGMVNNLTGELVSLEQIQNNSNYYICPYSENGQFDEEKWLERQYYVGDEFEIADYFLDLSFYLSNIYGVMCTKRDDKMDAETLYNVMLDLYKAYLKVFLKEKTAKNANISCIQFGIHYRWVPRKEAIAFDTESYENISWLGHNNQFDSTKISSHYLVRDYVEPFRCIENTTDDFYYDNNLYVKEGVTNEEYALLPAAKEKLLDNLARVDFEGLRLQTETKVPYPTRNPGEGWQYYFYQIEIDGNILTFRTDKEDPALLPIQREIIGALTDEQKELPAVQRILKAVS